MTLLLDDASLPTDEEGLQAQMAELDRRLAENQGRVQELMRAEDPAAGVFHAEAIHEAKQLAMMLRYQKELRQVRLNALRLQ
jgi:hypothetical protein